MAAWSVRPSGLPSSGASRRVVQAGSLRWHPAIERFFLDASSRTERRLAQTCPWLDEWPYGLRNFLAVVVGSWLAFGAVTAAAQTEPAGNCGNPFQNHYGPFDYRTATPFVLRIVERRHFTPGIESLTQLGTTNLFAADLGYTLHVLPNHHRALITMVRLGDRLKTNKPPGATYTIECYFQRGIVFASDDLLVRVIFADYLAKHGQKDYALAQVEYVLERTESPFLHYSVGGIFFELGDYERALDQAHKAAAMGLVRTDLEEALRAKGAWRDAVVKP